MICDGKLKRLHQFILNLTYTATTQGNKSTKKGYNSQCMAFVPRQGQSCCTGQISGQTVPLLNSSDLIKKGTNATTTAGVSLRAGHRAN